MNPSKQTIRSTIDYFANTKPNKQFVSYPESGRKYNWKDFQIRVKKIAENLSSLKLPYDSPISGLMGNGQAALELLLGGMYGGFQVFLANPLAGPEILAYVIDHSETNLFFVVPEYEELTEKAFSKLSKHPKIIKTHPENGPEWGQINLKNNNQIRSPKPEDNALLIYTSGTTGKPKGVVHSHKSLLYGGFNTKIAHELNTNDKTLCILPLYHINAQVVSVMGTLVSGSSLVLPERFKVSEFWNHIIKGGCTWFSAVPTIFSYLMNAKFDKSLKYKLKNLRFGRSASAPLPPALHKSFQERFGISIVETIGITETAAPLLSNPLNPKLHKIGSTGIPFGNKVRIANGNGEIAAVGEENEIQVKGHNIMKEYLKNPEATKEVFTKDGWYRTGDLGIKDKDGYFFITGRIKELIIKGGENIAPREIDDVLYRHKNVLEAAAFPLNDRNYGQIVAAAITVRPGQKVTESELKKLCNDKMGNFRTPSKFFFLDELPKGPSGKIQRLKLTKMYSKNN